MYCSLRCIVIISINQIQKPTIEFLDRNELSQKELAWSDKHERGHRLITVVVGLVGTGHGDGDVISLLLGEGGKLDTNGIKVKSSDLLVQVLGEDVHFTLLVLIVVPVGPELDLSKGLVGERVGHHERGVASGATQVHQSTLSKEDDGTTGILEEELVNLGLDVGSLAGVH